MSRVQLALQGKVWVNDPDGALSEVYAALSDAPEASGVSGDGHCCLPKPNDGSPLAIGSSSTAPASCC